MQCSGEPTLAGHELLLLWERWEAFLPVADLRFGGPHSRYYSNVFSSLVIADGFGASRWDHLCLPTQYVGFLLPISMLFNHFMDLVLAAAISGCI